MTDTDKKVQAAQPPINRPSSSAIKEPLLKLPKGIKPSLAKLVRA